MASEIIITLKIVCEGGIFKVENIVTDEAHGNNQNKTNETMQVTRVIQEQMKSLSNISTDNKKQDDDYYYGLKFSTL